MGVSNEVLGILVRLEGKTAFIAGVREEQDAIKGYSASTREAAASSDALAAADAKRAASVTLVNRAMAGLGLVVVAAGVESIKMSMEFNKQLEMVHTQAGASQAEVNSMRTSILNLKGVTQGPTELAEGLFHLESVGLRGAKALHALETAAHGATVGNANLEDVTTALGAAWIANVKGGGDLNHVMSVLNATVGAGNMHMEQLVQALGTGILPAAKLAGLSIQQVGAALAVLSDQGYAPSSAAAQLGTALHFLYAPSTKAKGALESLGLSQEILVNKLSGPNGALEALKALRDHLANVGGHAAQLEKLGEILPGGRGRVLLTLLEQLDRLELKQHQVESTSGQFGQDVEASMALPANRIKAAWSSVQKEMVKFGETMEGPAATALGIFAVAGIGLLQFLISATDNGHLLLPIILLLAGGFAAYKTAVLLSAVYTAAFAAVEAGVAAASVAAALGVDGLGAAFIGLGVAMDTAGIGLIFLAITAIILGIGLLISHFNAVKGWVMSNWRVIAAVILTMLAPITIVGGAIYMLITHWKAVRNFITGTAGAIGHALSSPFDFLWGKAKWVFDHIKSLWSGLTGGKNGGGFLSGLGGGISDALSSLPTIGPVFGAMKHFSEGGVMPYSGFAQINENGPGETVWLPGGSRVQPSSASSMGAPRAHTPNPTNRDEGGFPGLEATLVLPNGEVLADLVLKHVAIKKSRK